MHFTLRQLQVFLAVARHQNVSKAAESLAMSQSAASGALAELEKQFGIELFDRVGKRLQINELGLGLRPKVESLMQQALELERELAGQQGAIHLNIGATLSIGNYLCIGLMKRFMQQWPEARLNLDVNNTAHIVNEILNFEIDLGMVEGEINHKDLELIPWKQDRLVCFCSPEHPLAASGELKQEQFYQQPWILRELGSGTRQTFDRALGQQLHRLNVVMALQHTEAIKRAVEANLGLSCLSEITLQEAFKRGSLVPLKTASLDLARQLYLVIHKKKYRSRGIQKWITLCTTQ